MTASTRFDASRILRYYEGDCERASYTNKKEETSSAAKSAACAVQTLGEAAHETDVSQFKRKFLVDRISPVVEYCELTHAR